MGYGVSKRDNTYARAICDIDAPKTVWMAIAFAFAMRITGDDADAAHKLCVAEWQVLFDNGIVPQKVRIG